MTQFSVSKPAFGKQIKAHFSISLWSKQVPNSLAQLLGFLQLSLYKSSECRFSSVWQQCLFLSILSLWRIISRQWKLSWNLSLGRIVITGSSLCPLAQTLAPLCHMNRAPHESCAFPATSHSSRAGAQRGWMAHMHKLFPLKHSSLQYCFCLTKNNF